MDKADVYTTFLFLVDRHGWRGTWINGDHQEVVGVWKYLDGSYMFYNRFLGNAYDWLRVMYVTSSGGWTIDRPTAFLYVVCERKAGESGAWNTF